MNHVDERLHVLHGGLREDTVTEIEDMPGPTSGLVEDGSHPVANYRQACEQHQRIQVALDGYVVTDRTPSDVEPSPRGAVLVALLRRRRLSSR